MGTGGLCLIQLNGWTWSTTTAGPNKTRAPCQAPSASKRRPASTDHLRARIPDHADATGSLPLCSFGRDNACSVMTLCGATPTRWWGSIFTKTTARAEFRIAPSQRIEVGVRGLWVDAIDLRRGRDLGTRAAIIALHAMTKPVQRQPVCRRTGIGRRCRGGRSSGMRRRCPIARTRISPRACGVTCRLTLSISTVKHSTTALPRMPGIPGNKRLRTVRPGPP